MTTRLLMAVAALALLAACETAPMKAFTGDAKNAWAEIYRVVEQGRRRAQHRPQAVRRRRVPARGEEPAIRDRPGPAPTSDKVTAHKHLAFINCSQNRTGPCRDEFRKALAIDPSMELAPAEAGHPTWGPIFRSLKAGR